MNIDKRRMKVCIALFAACMTSAHSAAAATLRPQTIRGWEKYIDAAEKRINREVNQGPGFLVLDFKPAEEKARIRKLLEDGQVHVEKIRAEDARGKSIQAEDGMIHHWYGSVLIPGATLETVIPWVQSYDRHSEYFPEVEKSKLLSRNGESFTIFLRLVRKKVVTVHYNTEHRVIYRHRSPSQISSQSIASRIAEVSGAGTAAEKEKSSADDSGFLWRLNSYWRFEQTDAGVLVECESISLSRSIPLGLGWLVRPFVESVPRESLNNMLVAIRDGVVHDSTKI
jgi:hypothetical protein